MVDTVSLLQSLLRCPSVTPHEGGALSLLEKTLAAVGFECHRLRFSEEGHADVENLYARWGSGPPHICFAGHTDVVPTGNEKEWSFDPFGGVIRNGEICGRGAADMKGAIACFVVAALNFIKQHKGQKGSISFLITGDEEGPAVNGTKKVLDWLEARGEKIDFCLVGEPTSREVLGDMMKVGRRGTLTGYLSVSGMQGHVAYPHLADNPVPKLVRLLAALDELELDMGSDHFQPSNLEITNIEVGNTADNVIPAKASATFNVRFNDHYTGAALEKKIRDCLGQTGVPHALTVRIGGEPFYTGPGPEADLIAKAVEKVTGRKPELSTTGGTSDARFIRKFCPVIEFGIVGQTMHKTDERVSLSDLDNLESIYTETLKAWFKT